MHDKTLDPTSPEAQQESYFRIRLMTRLLAIFIFFTLAIQRVAVYCTPINTTIQSATYFWASMPFIFALGLIVIAKYFLYRRIGPHIFTYTKSIDLAFTIVFTVDWLIILRQQLTLTGSEEYRYSLASVVNLLGFSWRTLIQMLMAQNWVFKVIPTLCAYAYVLSFAAMNEPDKAAYILLVGTFQAIYVVLIYFFENKAHFRLLIGNLQQKHWLQLNEFILNSIPENIAIMDLNGNCEFISEHLKKLMKLCHHSYEAKQFFRQIKGLQKQSHIDSSKGAKETLDSIGLVEAQSLSETKSASSGPALLEDPLSGDSLEELITLFKNLIAKDFIKDKSFYVFNGKFKQDKLDDRSFEINLSFINHKFNKHILLILRDTTERDLILTLQGNIKYKDHLLDSLSHELRTPLNGNINLLQTAVKSNDRYDHIKETLLVPALKCSKFLLHMINDLLDMSQVKVQSLRLVFQQANIRETLVNAVQLLGCYATKKGLTLETEIHKDTPPLFCTDHRRLSQVIVNLMNHSIKNTQKGFVRLSAWPLRDKNEIQICIEDSGIGMTEEASRHLFKDFTQIEYKNRENLNPASFATGLKITNDLAELLGPKSKTGITLHSVCNKGSKFSFIIENKESGLRPQKKPKPEQYSCQGDQSPKVAKEIDPETDISLAVRVSRNFSNLSYTRPTKANHSSKPSSSSLNVSSSSSCSCARILVVDDDPFNIMAYEVILNSISVKYECVYSGKSAIDKMLNKVKSPCSPHCRPYRVVFMDEEMPGMTGSQTVAEIQSLQKKKALPQMSIIGCSAHHEGEEIERFMKSGIVDYLPKPISVNAIKKMIEKYDSSG